jgi:hypothetical protein
MFDKEWYQNHPPFANPFPDIHLSAHFASDTITYEEPGSSIPKYWTADKDKYSQYILYIQQTDNH